MKRSLTILLLNVILHSLFSQNIPIIPQPQDIMVGDGSFLLGKTTKVYADEIFHSELEFLRTKVLLNKGVALQKCRSVAQADIVLKCNEQMAMESYHLKIDSKSIVISASDAAGAFYGVVSLLQLVDVAEPVAGNIQITSLTASDAPEYAWRGLMLDESRHFFGIEKVKQIIDWMAYYKLNKFHWHLTDEPAWRVEILKYPMLTLVGGIGSYTNPLTPAQYYTQSQIREIVAYASARHIDVIPEIDMPGHATAANRAYPEYSGGGSKKHPEFTFHPAKEETYSYLTDILREVDVLFPSGMIHIGGDEVSYGNEMWKRDQGVLKLMKKQKMLDIKEVEDYFVRRMADSLIHLGSNVLVWDEMAGAGLPTGKSIVFWWRHDRLDQLRTALDAEHRVVLCPRLPFYFDFVQNEMHRVGRRWSGNLFNQLKDVYLFSAADVGVDDGRQSQILGVQANLWTETVVTSQRLDYLLFPRMAALAEASWSKSESKNFDEFLHRLKPHTDMYQKQGVFFFNPFDEKLSPEPVR